MLKFAIEAFVGCKNRLSNPAQRQLGLSELGEALVPRVAPDEVGNYVRALLLPTSQLDAHFKPQMDALPTKPEEMIVQGGQLARAMGEHLIDKKNVSVIVSPHGTTPAYAVQTPCKLATQFDIRRSWKMDAAPHNRKDRLFVNLMMNSGIERSGMEMYTAVPLLALGGPVGEQGVTVNFMRIAGAPMVVTPARLKAAVKVFNTLQNGEPANPLKVAQAAFEGDKWPSLALRGLERGHSFMVHEGASEAVRHLKPLVERLKDHGLGN